MEAVPAYPRFLARLASAYSLYAIAALCLGFHLRSSLAPMKRSIYSLKDSLDSGLGTISRGTGL